jgi:ribosomal protein L29
MKDIKKKDDTALRAYVSEKREEIRAGRFGIGTKDVKAHRTAKKEVARALFEIAARAKSTSNNA